MTNDHRNRGIILIFGIHLFMAFEHAQSSLGYLLQSGMLGFQSELYDHKVMPKSLADLVATMETFTGLKERLQESYSSKSGAHWLPHDQF